ncbi:hypothetical protein JOC77_003278 [Peribacillus deserti]|uniref:Uncharacterized protein n=1 Tax=Peribacillus deserti TaxID=673318 RepID=A0ABS2QKY4_9BACI|nr:hypothetical protein [Peribacillus deserti]MBM7693834.1 hypothetical protein [Peribacillus deserti]
MKTLQVEVKYDESAFQEGKVDVFTQLKEHLKDTGFHVSTISEGGTGETSGNLNSRPYDKGALPNQPENADPDVLTAGAGGMVSPDSDNYPIDKEGTR